MEISILAVNCRTFRFNRPCADGPFGSSRNNPPQRGAGTRDEPLEGPRKAQGRPVPLHDATGIWKRLCVPSAGKRGKLQTLSKVAVGRRVHFVNFILEDCYTLALVKKTIDKRLFEYVFQANVKTNKIVCDSKTRRVQEDTDISLSELEVT